MASNNDISLQPFLNSPSMSDQTGLARQPTARDQSAITTHVTVNGIRYKFSKWHGMGSVVEDIRAAVGLTGKGSLNGWAVLSVVVGVREVTNRLRSRLDTISLVCGLLLSASLGVMFSPPPQILQIEDIESSSVGMSFFCILSVSITSHFCCIIIGSLYVNVLHTAARDADRWRLVLNNGMLPAFIDLIFTIGNFALGIAMAVAIRSAYGLAASIVFGCFICTICGIMMHFFNSRRLLAYGHPIHGWFAHKSEEFDMATPFQIVEALAKHDSAYRSAHKASAPDGIEKPKQFLVA